MHEQQQLFETEKYYSVSSQLASRIGEEQGYPNSEIRNARLVLRFCDIYRPSEIETDFTSLYPISQRHPNLDDDDFRYWKKTSENFQLREGYLVGFPTIKSVLTGTELRCVHFWTNNSSVFDDTFAVPLSSVAQLSVYSRQLTEINIDLDEVAMGAKPRYEIPVLKDTKTGNIISICSVNKVADLLYEREKPTIVLDDGNWHNDKKPNFVSFPKSLDGILRR